ncbi:hypothetical protein [Streptosporangium sp. NPDC006930]|uniref:hypothetical protein n=1 Tax=Streptosporangium sp. NPDC006930 TaxID=3154783 RepID=UPI003412A57A
MEPLMSGFPGHIEIDGFEVLRIEAARSNIDRSTGIGRLTLDLRVRETETADGEHIPTTAERVTDALIALGWTPPAP